MKAASFESQGSSSTIKASGSAGKPMLSIVSAKDYVPGKENEVLEGVQELLVTSTKLVKRKSTKETSERLRQARTSEQEEKKSDQAGDINASNTGTSPYWTPGEMDGIIDSMTYVLEVMETYQEKAHKAALDYLEEQALGYLEEQDLTAKVDQLDKDSGLWNLNEVAKDLSAADFLLGSFMPNQSGDEYPEGSQPILHKQTFLSPTADMFLGSLASVFGMKPEDKQLHNGNLLMDSKLRYLEDVQSVQSVCASQIYELDTILSNQGMQELETIQEVGTAEEQGTVEELDTDLSNVGAARAFELRQMGTMNSYDNSVVTRDVEDQPHPPLNKAAMSYIQAARDKLSEYSGLAQKILNDEVKCMVSEYACASEKCDEDTTTNDKQDGLHFEALKKHFYGDAYNMEIKTHLAVEQDDKMQRMLLNTLHSSLFLRNVRDKCQQPIRLHVGRELSVSICNVIMGSLLNSKKKHRMTKWGACLFAKHVRALHAYVFEFCWSTESTDDLLAKVEKSSLDVRPIDANWERLFSAIDILKVKSLEDYNDRMLHPLCTSNDARKILQLRTEFSDDAINARILPSRSLMDERILG